MAEVGLVPFARVALAVARAVIPPFRHPRSKHVFTQPQLLAILCLMRYEDWTFREAEVRLSEHRELRRALGLRRVPDYTTLCRVLARLDPTDIALVVAETSRRLPPGPRPPGGGRGALIGVDATGLTTGAVSTYVVRRLRRRLAGAAPGRVGSSGSSPWTPRAASSWPKIPIAGPSYWLKPCSLAAA